MVTRFAQEHFELVPPSSCYYLTLQPLLRMPAGMGSGEPSATKPMAALLLSPVLTFYSGLSHPFMRGHQRLTFRQYTSYSAPNFQRRFFIEDYEQMHAESNCCDRGNRQQVRVSEDNPQSDPTRGEAHVHGNAHVAVEAYNH